MKANEYLKTLTAKDAAGLEAELAALRREQFNLRLQRATGQEVKTHLARDVRRRIAQLKTVMRQKTQEQAKA